MSNINTRHLFHEDDDLLLSRVIHERRCWGWYLELWWGLKLGFIWIQFFLSSNGAYMSMNIGSIGKELNHSSASEFNFRCQCEIFFEPWGLSWPWWASKVLHDFQRNSILPNAIFLFLIALEGLTSLVWMVVEIDIFKLDSRYVSINIYISTYYNLQTSPFSWKKQHGIICRA